MVIDESQEDLGSGQPQIETNDDEIIIPEDTCPDELPDEEASYNDLQTEAARDRQEKLLVADLVKLIWMT